MPLKKSLLIFLILLFLGDVEAIQIEGVPLFKQERNKCGPSALASVLSYYGAQVDELQIIEATYTPSLKGSLITDLENYAKGLGYQTRSGQGTIEILKTAITSKKPIIVLMDIGVWLVSKPHFIVILGYDKDGFVVHDGSKPSTLIKYSKFEKAWRKMGRPYLLIYP